MIKCNWRKAKKILSKAAVPAIAPNQFTQKERKNMDKGQQIKIIRSLI